jgi:hypothetical protein
VSSTTLCTAQRTVTATPQTPRSPVTSASLRSLGRLSPCIPRSLSGLRGSWVSSSHHPSSASSREPPRVGARRICSAPRCERHAGGCGTRNHIRRPDRSAGGGRTTLRRFPARRGVAIEGGATTEGGKAREAGGRAHNTADPARRTTTRRREAWEAYPAVAFRRHRLLDRTRGCSNNQGTNKEEAEHGQRSRSIRQGCRTVREAA